MCCERFWRGEEIGRWVGSQSPSEMLRDAEGRERRDGWCATDLPYATSGLHVELKPGPEDGLWRSLSWSLLHRGLARWCRLQATQLCVVEGAG